MPLQYDERQKTRVYRREQEAQQPYDERIGFTQPLTKPKGVLADISIAQVIAGAAAAATSMLLASKIGIAGSVIGAAVSSAVTIICSQLYRRALEKSAEKLKLDQLGLSTSETQPNAELRGNSRFTTVPSAGGTGRGARIAPANLRLRAAEERRSTQRKVLAVSVALAAIAVVLTAAAILLGTAGQGLGDRPAPLLLSATPQQQSNDSVDTGAAGANDGDGRTDAVQQEPDENDTGNADSEESGDQPSDTGNKGESSGQPGETDEGNDASAENPNASGSKPHPETGSDAGTDGSVEGDTETNTPAAR